MYIRTLVHCMKNGIRTKRNWDIGLSFEKTNKMRCVHCILKGLFAIRIKLATLEELKKIKHDVEKMLPHLKLGNIQKSRD